MNLSAAIPTPSTRSNDGRPICSTSGSRSAAGSSRRCGSSGWPSGRGVVVIHGVQSHSGWYHGLGRTLAEAGYETHFPDRRGSGANQQDRGHTPSASRLVADIAERLQTLRALDPKVPLALAGISWGGKT